MISVTILSYKNPALLRLCLKSIRKSLEDDSGLEVIIVDNETSPETQSVVRDEFAKIFKNIRLIAQKENTGYTKGVNIGLKAAKGDCIISLNQDIVVQPGALQKLSDFLRDHPEVGLLGPELLNFDGSHQDSYFRFYNPFTVLYRRRVLPLPFSRRIMDRFLMRDTDKTTIQYPDWISGAAFAVTRDAIRKVGYLDERLFHYFSDVDWSRRFWENGYKVVYYPEAKLFHYLGQDSKGKFWFLDLFFKKTARWHTADGLKYFWKYGFLKWEYFKELAFSIKSVKHS